MNDGLPRDLFRRVDRALMNPTRVTAWNGSARPARTTLCVGIPGWAVWTDDDDGTIYVDPNGAVYVLVPNASHDGFRSVPYDNPDPQLYRTLADVVWGNANA